MNVRTYNGQYKKLVKNHYPQLPQIRWFSKVLWSCIILLIGISTLKAQQKFEAEVRGVWITNVDSDVLDSQQNIADAMDFLAKNGINVVFPVVYNAGYTQYPSQVMENYFGPSFRQDPAFKSQGRDPLQEIIIEAHRNGMEVIPWFEYGFAYLFSRKGQPPTGDSHFARQYPQWLAKTVDGDIVKKNGFEWLNAIHPEVQTFMLALFEEVIKNYDIDGIQGDDRLPAMAAQAGYSDKTVEIYKQEHGGQEPPSDYKDDEFMQWKADKLTAFGHDLYKMVKSYDENLIVSMSPSIYKFSFNNFLQDWPQWLEDEQVDMIHPQAYRFLISEYRQIIFQMVGTDPTSTFGQINSEHHDKISPGVLVKSGGRFNGPDYVREAISVNRRLELQGEVYFFYEGLAEKNDYLADTLGAGPYSKPAVLPFRNKKIRRPKPLIVNETDPEIELTGSWDLEGTPSGFNRRSLVAEPGSGSTITYVMDIPHSASYHILAYIPRGNAATESAYYELNGADIDTTVQIDQTLEKNKGWFQLGSVFLEKGLNRPLTIHADSVRDSGKTYVDAAMVMLDRKRSPEVDIDAVFTNLQDDTNVSNERPKTHKLLDNYPNPFNPTTNIVFELNKPDIISIRIYTVTGRKIKDLIQNRQFTGGRHTVTFDARELASGVYMYQLQSQTGYQDSGLMTLIK